MHEHLIRTQFYKFVLEQTSIISVKSQSKITVIYEMRNVIKVASENLKEIKDEETNLPCPSNQVSEDNEDKITITLTASNLSSTKLEDEMSEGQLEKSKQFVTSVRKEFEVQNVRQGRNTEKTVKEKLLPIIENKLSFRFSYLLENSLFNAFSVFVIGLWTESDDAKNLKSFSDSLGFPGNGDVSAKREWKKTNRGIRGNYLHLAKESHGLMWSRYITNNAVTSPNKCMLLETLLIFLFSLLLSREEYQPF